MIFIVIAPQLGVCGRCRIRKLTARVRTGIAVCDQLYELETGALFHERRYCGLCCVTLRDNQRPNSFGLFDAAMALRHWLTQAGRRKHVRTAEIVEVLTPSERLQSGRLLVRSRR
jgi:hypothetical protein